MCFDRRIALDMRPRDLAFDLSCFRTFGLNKGVIYGIMSHPLMGLIPLKMRDLSPMVTLSTYQFFLGR